MSRDQEAGEASRTGAESRLRRWYGEAALVLMNTVVLVVALNVVLFAAFAYKDYRLKRLAEELGEANDPAVKYGKGFMAEVYPGWGEQELDSLMAESWGRPFLFEPFTQFKEPPVRGKYVNIDENGFRRGKDQAPWPPREESFSVFFFGGSTTFGYGLPDDQTIPSRVQEILSLGSCGRSVAVYNFGRGFYYSTQERAAFEQLVISGHRPDLAVFVDGLNDFYYPEDRPRFTEHLEAVVRGDYDALVPANHQAGHKIPIVRAARGVLRRFSPERPPLEKPWTPTAPAQDTADAERVIRRWAANRAIIDAVGREFAIPTLFVWQPVPTYGYDLSYHPFSGGDLDLFKEHRLSYTGYPLMKQRLAAEPVPNLLWLADVQRGRREELYVDMVHYTAEFSHEIAERIAERILADGLICGASRS